MCGKYRFVLIVTAFLCVLSAQDDAALIREHYFETPQYRKTFANPKITTDLRSDGEDTPFTARLFMRAVRLYKDYISPQDLDVCTFHPSCSEYAFLCLKHQSLPEALLNSGDRLLRCYGSNELYYPKDPRYGLCEDHPDTSR